MSRTKTVSEKFMFSLLVWGLLLIFFAYLADCVLDAVLFGAGSVWEQLVSPSYHEIAIRALFSVFILAVTCLGAHYLARSARIEKVTRQRNEDLLLANQELEEFTYSLADDLRNSLSDLCASTALLKAQCAEEEDERLRFLTQKIYRLGETLEGQIDPIMKLAVVAGGDLQRKEVRLDHLVRDITKNLLAGQANDRIEVDVKPNLRAWCDPKLMHLALENLLSNAFKFIPGNRKGRVTFGKTERKGKTVYYLQDNGIGFDEEIAERIFDNFRRQTGGDDEGQSSEISLAAVRRVIQRHGGEIWAEGIPDAGATFYFTLRDR